MIDIRFTRRTINIEALDRTLRDVLQERVIGVSAGASGIVIHLDDSASDAEIDTVGSILDAHDPALLSERQQCEQNRRDQLENDRNTNETPIDLDDFLTQPQIVRELARRLAWIEREIRALRDL